MKGPNPIVGVVPCPICGKDCDVRQFRDHTGGALTRRRKAGKFYFDCKKHGRFGFDGNAAMQEHVLEHITWSDESARAAAGAAPTATTSPNSPAASKSPERPSTQPSASSRPAAPKRPASPGNTSSGKQTPTQTQTAPAKGMTWLDAWEDL